MILKHRHWKNCRESKECFSNTTFEGYYLKIDCIVLPCLVCLCKGATEDETRKDYTCTAYAQETQVIHYQVSMVMYTSIHTDWNIYSTKYIGSLLKLLIFNRICFYRELCWILIYFSVYFSSEFFGITLTIHLLSSSY